MSISCTKEVNLDCRAIVLIFFSHAFLFIEIKLESTSRKIKIDETTKEINSEKIQIIEDDHREDEEEGDGNYFDFSDNKNNAEKNKKGAQYTSAANHWSTSIFCQKPFIPTILIILLHTFFLF
jgi:ATP-dependent Zn protease